jgi:hypothetical protein
MAQLLGVIGEKVPPELTTIAVSLWLIVLLGLTSVVYLEGHHLVHGSDHRLVRCLGSSRRIRTDSQIVRESLPPLTAMTARESLGR